MDWVLYTLFFIFGYSTCKTFYYLNSSRISIRLIKVAQLISLTIVAKALEHYSYAFEYKTMRMKEEGESEHNLEVLKNTHNNEVESFKKRTIQFIIEAHPEFFRKIIEFDDWESSMKFLDQHEDLTKIFLS